MINANEMISGTKIFKNKIKIVLPRKNRNNSNMYKKIRINVKLS